MIPLPCSTIKVMAVSFSVGRLLPSVYDSSSTALLTLRFRLFLNHASASFFSILNPYFPAAMSIVEKTGRITVQANRLPQCHIGDFNAILDIHMK